MTSWLAFVSCKIPGMSWHKHHQTSFRLKFVLSISIKLVISAVVHLNIYRYTSKQHPTNLLQIVGSSESPAACSYTQMAFSWVKRASWLSLILLRLESNYIFLITSHFFSLSSSSLLPQLQVMAQHTPQPVGADPNRAEWQPLHPICHLPRHSSNTDTC